MLILPWIGPADENCSLLSCQGCGLRSSPWLCVTVGLAAIAMNEQRRRLEYAITSLEEC